MCFPSEGKCGRTYMSGWQNEISGQLLLYFSPSSIVCENHDWFLFKTNWPDCRICFPSQGKRGRTYQGDRIRYSDNFLLCLFPSNIFSQNRLLLFKLMLTWLQNSIFHLKFCFPDTEGKHGRTYQGWQNEMLRYLYFVRFHLKENVGGHITVTEWDIRAIHHRHFLLYFSPLRQHLWKP